MVAPELFNCTDAPKHIAVSLVVFTIGFSTVIFTLSRLIKNDANEISSNAKSLAWGIALLFTIEMVAVVAFPEFQVALNCLQVQVGRFDIVVDPI